jgi:hypothetical protein
MSPICASWPVNRSTGCSVTLIRWVFARSRSSLPPSVSTQICTPARHATGAGHRDLQVQLHRPGPELNRLPQASRLCHAQVTAHRGDRVRQARELTVFLTHAKHPLHPASSRHTRPQRQQLPERETVLGFPGWHSTRPAPYPWWPGRPSVRAPGPAAAHQPSIPVATAGPAQPSDNGRLSGTTSAPASDHARRGTPPPARLGHVIRYIC